MELELVLRWLHVIGACVLLGTGAGIAFFMVMAHRTGEAPIVAAVASIVVIADYLFTASAVVLQPLTGVWLAVEVGWPLTEPWVLLSVLLYVVVGLCWLPVVWIQIRLRDLAREAATAGAPLPQRYHRLFRIWFALGVPAFIGVLTILWLMLARPALGALSRSAPEPRLTPSHRALTALHTQHLVSTSEGSVSKSGYVYVIASAAHEERCKIGMTLQEPAKRLRQLQTGNSAKLSLYDAARVPDPRATERTLHERLKEFRIRNGEWFAIHPRDAARLLHKLAAPPRRPLIWILSTLVNLGILAGLAYFWFGG